MRLFQYVGEACVLLALHKTMEQGERLGRDAASKLDAKSALTEDAATEGTDPECGASPLCHTGNKLYPDPRVVRAFCPNSDIPGKIDTNKSENT